MDVLDTKTIEVAPERPGPGLEVVPCLVLVAGERPGLCVELPAALTIGRDTSCRLRFQDPGLSKIHCRLRREGERVLLSDLGSTNGTHVDGRRVEGQLELRPGAILQLGSQVLRLEARPRAEIEHARELSSDLERARAYVAALLPPPLAAGPVRVEGCHRPTALLGGDLYGHHALDARRRAFYVLDVCGHGAGPALHTASLLNVIKNQTLPATDFARPEEVLARLNERFPMERHGGLFTTVWYGVHDAVDGSLRYASAGHPPALLRRADGTLARLGTAHPPIGVLEERAFPAASAATGPGDRLYVFSDGVYEIIARDGREWSLADLEALVRAPAVPGLAETERIRAAVEAAAGRVALADDFTLLVASFEPSENACSST